jgi:hypothetical protein
MSNNVLEKPIWMPSFCNLSVTYVYVCMYVCMYVPVSVAEQSKACTVYDRLVLFYVGRGLASG